MQEVPGIISTRTIKNMVRHTPATGYSPQSKDNTWYTYATVAPVGLAATAMKHQPQANSGFANTHQTCPNITVISRLTDWGISHPRHAAASGQHEKQRLGRHNQ
jgi:hypothetical protein